MKYLRHSVALLVIGSVLLLVGGCAAPSSSESIVDSAVPSEEPTAEAPAQPPSTPADSPIPELPNGEVVNVTQLRAALEGIGVDCSTWTQDDLVAGTTGSGWCFDQWGLSTFPDAATRNVVLALSNDSLEPQAFLVGGNWLITRGYNDPADLEGVRSELGGEIWNPGDPYPVI